MSAFNPLTDSVQCLDSNNSVQMKNPYTFNGVNYGSYNFIGMGVGTYTFTGVTTSHPLGFVIDNTSLFEVISGTAYGTKTVENKEITHYHGTIVVEVKGDFGQISYNCYHHGYMGGQNKLVYHEPCLEINAPTPTPSLTPTLTPGCVSSPLTITVESEYLGPGNSLYKYITSDSNGEGGLFGCINVERGSALTIFADGDEPNLISHPLIITNYNSQGQAMAPLDGVIKTDLTSGPQEDYTYSLTWKVPCDPTVDKYQYQSENSAGMGGVINVTGSCVIPLPTLTPTPTTTLTETPLTPFQSTETIVIPISETIVTKDDFKKFLSGCGSTSLSVEIDSYQIIHQLPNLTFFSVTYTCDLNQERGIEYCYATWESNCDGIYSISSPVFQCFSSFSAPALGWTYSSEKNSILYSSLISTCDNGCNSSTSTPLINDEIKSLCPNYTPTFTETVTLTYSETKTLTPQLPNLYSNVKLTGIEPNKDLSIFFGSSILLQKPNLTDKNSRVFYAETSNGYFYELNTRALNNNDTATYPDFISYNGQNLFFNKNYDSKFYRAYSIYDIFFSNLDVYFTPTSTETLLQDFELVSSSVCLETELTPTFTESATPTTVIVKDLSLFKNVFEHSSLDNDLYTSPTLALNLNYWFSDLPELIYGNSNWLSSVPIENVPTIEIIQNPNSFVYPIHSFSKDFLSEKFSALDFSHASPTPTTTSTISFNGDIYFNFVPADFYSRFYRQFFLDPINQMHYRSNSAFSELTLKYSFTPQRSSIDSALDPNLIPTTIIREEKIQKLISPNHNEDDEYTFLNETPTSTQKIHGVDKTNGAINQNNKVEKGSMVILKKFF